MFLSKWQCISKVKAIRKIWLITVVLLFISLSKVNAQAPQCGPYSQFYSKDSVVVTTFGASTVQGYPAPFSFQLPLTRFIENCYAGKVVEIGNYGVYGETTAQGLKRIDKVLEGKKGFLLLLIGVNDAIQIAEGRLNVNQTLHNMSELIQRGKDKNLSVVVGTLQYFKEIPGNTPEARLIRRRNFFIDQINNGYKKLAEAMSVRIADINRVFGKNSMLYADGVHPNSRGYYVIALVWFDAINQEVRNRYLEPGITQNYPNPASGITKIGLSLPNSTRLIIKVFNITGKLITTVVDDFRNSGYFEETFDVSGLEAGLYFIQVNISGKNYVKKLLVSR